MNTNRSTDSRKISNISSLAVAALSMMSIATAAGAQSNTQNKPQIQLAFGYECGDKFLVRNDGTQPVDVEYSLVGTKQRSKLHLNVADGVEIQSQANGPMELWVNGRVVSTEQKGNKGCAVNAGDQDVIVRGIGDGASTTSAGTSAATTSSGGGDVVYVAAQPQRVVYVTAPVGYAYDPYYYGWGFGVGYDYGYYGYPSYYRSGISVNFPIYSRPVYRAPVVLSNRGFGGSGRPSGGFGRPVSGGHFGGGFSGGHGRR